MVERLNVKQAAARAGVSRQTIRRMREDGRLPRRGSWTEEELAQALDAKPPKKPNPSKPAPKNTGAPADDAPREGNGADARPSRPPTPPSGADRSAPGPSSAPEGDPLDLNLPLPDQGAPRGSPLPGAADADDQPAAGAPDHPAAPPARGMFDDWFAQGA